MELQHDWVVDLDNSPCMSQITFRIQHFVPFMHACIIFIFLSSSLLLCSPVSTSASLSRKVTHWTPRAAENTVRKAGQKDNEQ